MGAETSDQTKLTGDAQAPLKSSTADFSTQNCGYLNVETARNIVQKSFLDSAAPFESVKKVVSLYGGNVDWKALKIQKSERQKDAQLQHEKRQKDAELQHEKVKANVLQFEATEFQKVQAVEELSINKKLISELDFELDKSMMEDNQTKQGFESAHLTVKESEEAKTDEAIITAKAQKVAFEARYIAALKDLEIVESELNTMRREYKALFDEKTVAMNLVEEAAAAFREVEKNVKELTSELKMTKEALESAHAAHMDVEEKRVASSMAKDQEELNWAKKLEAAEKEVKKLNEQLESLNQTRSKLEASSQLLSNLRLELSTHMQVKDIIQINDGVKKVDENGCTQQSSLTLVREELKDIRKQINKASKDANYLKVAAVSLKTELKGAKAELATTKQRQEKTTAAVASLEAELATAISELESVEKKERERRAELEKLTATIQQATQDAAKEISNDKLVDKEYRKEKEEAELVKAELNTTKSKVNAAVKEMEASTASEKLALAAIKAMEGSETGASLRSEFGTTTLTLEEYSRLSKQAFESEQEAKIRISSVLSHLEQSKESKSQSMEKLDELINEREKTKEHLRLAIENAEKAREEELTVEHELKMWRDKFEERRRNSELFIPRSSTSSLQEMREHNSFDNSELSAIKTQQALHDQNFSIFRSEVDTVESQSNSMKKLSFFPRIVMFLVKKAN